MYIETSDNSPSAEQKGLKAWEDDFCVEMAKGITTQEKAYRIARRTPDSTKSSTIGKKSTAMMKRPEIKARIKEIRNEIAQYDLLSMFDDIDEAINNEKNRPDEGFGARSNFAVAKFIEMKAKASGLLEKDNIMKIAGAVDHKHTGIPTSFNIVIDSGQVNSEGKNDSE